MLLQPGLLAIQSMAMEWLLGCLRPHRECICRSEATGRLLLLGARRARHHLLFLQLLTFWGAMLLLLLQQWRLVRAFMHLGLVLLLLSWRAALLASPCRRRHLR
jgi:hypothetical protein